MKLMLFTPVAFFLPKWKLMAMDLLALEVTVAGEGDGWGKGAYD